MEHWFFLKIYTQYRHLVAVCDADLLGKKFEEGKRQLDVREGFYKGEEVFAEQLVTILKHESQEDATFNIVGKNSVQIALEVGIIVRGNIGYVQGIPFALVLL